MKRFWVIILILLFLIFCFIRCCRSKEPEQQLSYDEFYSRETEASEKNETEKFIGVWINYNELSMKKESGGNEESFRKKVGDMFSRCESLGVNNLFVQVRPFCDAFYKSDIFPYSEYITGKQGVNPNYDPLKIMTEEAKKRGLKIHAWINPYRVSYKTDINTLSKTSPAYILYNEKGNDVYIGESGIYLNPASDKAKKLVLEGVRELLSYNIDGIHLDDYFYPNKDEKIDKAEYEKYRSSGGSLSLEDWRRSHVTSLVGMLYSEIKAASPGILFGISPMGDIEKNYASLYADIPLWCSKTGYVDYIMPQLYYGFENEKLPFEKTAESWKALAEKGNVKIYGGLALYKLGKEDKFAGEQSEKKDTARYEWVNNKDVISRQIAVLEELKYGGTVFYSYSSLSNLTE